MMKKLINKPLFRETLAVALLFFPSISKADRPYYRIYTDASGSFVGSSTTLPNGQITYRDRRGKPTAYSTKGSYSNSRIYSDNSGSYQFRETYLNKNRGNSTFYGRNGSEIGYGRGNK